MTDTELKWTPVPPAPTVLGWYWLRRKDGNREMWSFDGSDWDIHFIETKCDFVYGPLQPPPEDDE